MSGQTVQTQIRLLLEEQSDQGLHCLLYHLHILETFLCCKANWLEFYGDYSNIFGVRKFRTFTVCRMISTFVVSSVDSIITKVSTSINEPRCEKTSLWGFRPGPTQTGLCNHRKCLEA